MEKSIKELMETPLPSLTEQRKLAYRPSIKEVNKLYDQLNKDIFQNKLVRPEIQLGIRRQCWGICLGYVKPRKPGTWCVIKLSDKWYCKQWLIAILAHEMSHQYQWDIIGPKRYLKGKDFLMSHGPTFFQHRDRMLKYNIPLKVSFRKSRWFRYQHIQYC
jgi:hypothetical protein